MLVETIVGLLLVPSWAGGLDFTMTASIPATSFSPFQASLPATALNSFAPFQVSAPASIPTSAPRAAPVSAPASVPALPPSVLAFLQASVPAPPFYSLPPLTAPTPAPLGISLFQDAPTPAPLGISLFQDAPTECVKCGDACKPDGRPGPGFCWVLHKKDSSTSLRCSPSESPPICRTLCTTDAICAAGQACFKGECTNTAGRPCSNPFTPPHLALDCPSGFHCMEGKCCPNVACVPDSRCEAGVKPNFDSNGCATCPVCAGCSSDSECRSGTCLANGQCKVCPVILRCASSITCPGETTTPRDSNGCPLCPVCVSCNDNSHCTAGKICVNGKCAAGTTCSSSSGILATTISACPSGYRCMNGQCQVCPAVICANPNCPGGTAGTTTSVDAYGCPGCPKCADVCTENTNCPRGQRCFEGKCSTRACDTSSNCPGKGHRCVNGQCTVCPTLTNCFTSICRGTLTPTTLKNGCPGCPKCVF